MDPVVPMQNKNFPEDPEEADDVPGTRAES